MWKGVAPVPCSCLDSGGESGAVRVVGDEQRALLGVKRNQWGEENGVGWVVGRTGTCARTRVAQRGSFPSCCPASPSQRLGVLSRSGAALAAAAHPVPAAGPAWPCGAALPQHLGRWEKGPVGVKEEGNDSNPCKSVSRKPAVITCHLGARARGRGGASGGSVPQDIPVPNREGTRSSWAGAPQTLLLPLPPVWGR